MMATKIDARTGAGGRGLLAAGLLAGLVGGCGSDRDDGAPVPGCFALADGRCVEETFHNPPVLEPNADGVYELELAPTEFMVDGQRHCGRAYNGMYPGPTIDTPAAADGEPRQVRVDLRNAFSKSDYRALGSEPCTCVDAASKLPCTPDPAHGAHGTCECTTAEGKMCHVFDFNVTNLHAHGSHVRPDAAAGGGCVAEDGLKCRECTDGSGDDTCYFADDVLSRVQPGEGVRHRWDIDEDGQHHAGLNWYHPHIHGSTAIQVASGATGAWIVRGALDEIPGIKDARERIMVLSTPPIGYAPLADGQACDEDHITFNEFATLGKTSEKQTNLINGLRRPRLIMAPGQIERWRLLHGSFLDEVFLTLLRSKDSDCEDLDLTRPPVRLTQIGRDGLALPRPTSGEDWPYAPDYIFMSPGYRVEALLDGGELADGDTLCLVAGRFLQEDGTGTTDEAVGITKPPTPAEILKTASNGDLVAIVNVTTAAGAPTQTRMPDLAVVAKEAPSMMLQGGTLDGLERCAEAQKVDSIDQIDQVSALWMLFANTDAPDGCACSDHNINCKNFEYTDRSKYPYDRVLTKGAVDHWRIFSGFDGHPFHIHINPFLVCPLPPAGSPEPNAKSRIFEPPFAHWRDTYLVNLDRTLDMLTEYRGFTGSFVYHCHKLNHEDHGMMELLRVCDPAVESCDELCAGGPCSWRDCAPGDESCVRALTATECLLDPSRCPEAALRCLPCSPDQTCPPNAFCRDDEDIDGKLRCAPGCLGPEDCLAIDTCTDGACVPAPCPMPCLPGELCTHGVCE